MKSMSPRQSKVASEVRHIAALALVQGRIASTLPTSRFTVVECWVSADLKLARLYLQLPAELDAAETLAQANAQLAAPLRKFLATQLATKFIPQISFHPAEE